MYDELVKRLRTTKVTVYKAEDVNLLQEAANAIEELSAVNERQLLEITVLSKLRWIPVTERLPHADGFTLIFTAHGHAGVCYFTSGWWGGYDKGGITHWMPLPPPPKGE